MQTSAPRSRIPGKVIVPVVLIAISAIAASAWIFLHGAPQTEPTASLRVVAVELSLDAIAGPSRPGVELDLSGLDLDLNLDNLPSGDTGDQPDTADAGQVAVLQLPSADSGSPQQADPPQDAVLGVPPPPVEVLDTTLPEPGAGDQVAALAPAVAQPGGGLPLAPDDDLIERTPQGPLPRIGDDGRQPWRAYARPFDGADARPRVAVVLTGLGLSQAATDAAIQDLPGAVTLAYQPYATGLQNWIQLSRAAGHEVLLHLPMEPVDYPDSDPGPQALFTSLTPQQNLARLEWALSRVSGYVGVANHMGSRFTTNRSALQPVMEQIKERGLLYVDTRSSARSIAASLATELGVPRALNDRFLDVGSINRTIIDGHLAEAERIARETGLSVVVGQPYPLTIERIRAWAVGLEERGISLAPISAVVNMQGDR